MGWRAIVDAWRAPQTACGALDVVLDNASHLPGDVVSGRVFLDVHTPVNDAELAVVYRCEERLQSEITDPQGVETLDELLAQDRHVLCRDSLVAGQVVVRFSVQIPEGVRETTAIDFSRKSSTPSSESHRINSQLTIVHTLTVELIVREKGFADLKREIPLHVSAPPTAVPLGKPVEQSTCAVFHYACGLKKSFCRMRARLDADVVCLQSTLTARVWIDIGTPERLEWIRLSLDRLVEARGTKLCTWRPDRQCVASARFAKDSLGSVRECLLRLPLASAHNQLHPTAAFFHVDIRYVAMVACKVRGCNELKVELPVVVEPPYACLTPRVEL